MVESNILNFIKSLDYSVESKFLLAVSGGVDSMVLLDIFAKNYTIAVAHVNHGMRGEESDKDADLVKDFCHKNKIAFHYTDLPDELKTKGNFQSIARTFRYDFFNTLLIENDFDFIVTAHHKNDTIETVLMNMLRGTGLEGLQGIPSVNISLNVIRPLINTSRQEIENYAHRNQITYREDRSNAKDDYKRNHIRHHFVPMIEENYGLDGVYHTVTNVKKYYAQYRSMIDQILCPVVEMHQLQISKSKLEAIFNPPLALFHYAKEYGFNIDHCLNLLENKTGKTIVIRNLEYEMVKDQSQIIIRKLSESSPVNIVISDYGSVEIKQFVVKILSNNDAILEKTNHGLHLSFDENPFPLIFRSRQEGDNFKPSGMQGCSKKVKKYIIDSKLTIEEKDKLFIIQKNDAVIAVFPYRVSEGYAYDKDKPYQLWISINYI